MRNFIVYTIQQIIVRVVFKFKNPFKILTGKPTRKRLLGRSRHRWEDIIRIDLEKIGVSMRNWSNSSQDRDY